MRSTLLALGVALVALSSGAAHAEFVSNGGFETNDGSAIFAGWANNGNGIVVDQFNPNSGASDALFTAPSNDPSPGTLSQSVATIANQDLTLSFALLDAFGSQSDTFTVTLGGFSTTITGDQAGPSLSYTLFDLAIPGADITGPSTLSFQGLNDNGGWNLDDVSLTAASVPEPSALLVFGMGILGLASLFRLRRRGPRS